MNPATVAPPVTAQPIRRESLGRRLLRELFIDVLVVIIALLVLLIALPNSSDSRAALLAGIGDEVNKANVRTLVILGVGTLVFCLVLSWFVRKLRWRTIGIGYALIAPVLIYLAVDSRELVWAPTYEQLSPPPPDGAASYAVLMRYGNQRPAGREFGASKMSKWMAIDRKKPQEWIDFITEHRATIEADWEKLAPLRTWLVDVERFAEIADLMPARQDAEILAFRPVRELSQRTCAMATLLAVDGRGDEAMEMLVPLLSVARKLQPHTRSLVHYMIAIVIERMAMETAHIIIDRATVSAGVRARLAAVLTRPGGGEAGARRLLAIEYILAVNAHRDRPLGDCIESVRHRSAMRRTLNLLSPVIYNSRTTFNLYAALSKDQQDAIARRDLTALGERTKRFLEEETQPRFKNFAGAILAYYFVPAVEKVAAAYWKAQDERTELLKRVSPP